jgi:hypothetical protein
MPQASHPDGYRNSRVIQHACIAVPHGVQSGRLESQTIRDWPEDGFNNVRIVHRLTVLAHEQQPVIVAFVTVLEVRL